MPNQYVKVKDLKFVPQTLTQRLGSVDVQHTLHNKAPFSVNDGQPDMLGTSMSIYIFIFTDLSGFSWIFWQMTEKRIWWWQLKLQDDGDDGNDGDDDDNDYFAHILTEDREYKFG